MANIERPVPGSVPEFQNNQPESMDGWSAHVADFAKNIEAKALAKGVDLGEDRGANKALSFAVDNANEFKSELTDLVTTLGTIDSGPLYVKFGSEYGGLALDQDGEIVLIHIDKAAIVEPLESMPALDVDTGKMSDPKPLRFTDAYTVLTGPDAGGMFTTDERPLELKAASGRWGTPEAEA